MRDIKFRGKSVMTIEELDTRGFEHKNGWFYGNLVMYGNMPYIVGDFIEVGEDYTVNEFWVPVHPTSVGQYTGLKDSKRKEIYEGDIFRDIDGFLWKVSFSDGGFIAEGGEWNLTEALIEFVPDHCEVIGNIYEHSHLLK